jgi:hypothetical protein
VSADALGADGRSRSARWALAAVAVAITGLFAWLAVRTIDLGLTWEALRESDVAWIAPSFALLALSLAVRALRWWALFAPGRRPPLRHTAAALLVGLFFNSILPLRAGEAARLVYLARRTRVSRTETAATIAVERLFDVLALLLLLFVALPFLPEVTWIRAAAWLALALGLALALAVAVLVVFGDRALRVLLWPLRWAPFVSPERWEQAPTMLGHGLAALRRPGLAATAMALTTVSWLVMAASFWALMPAFDLGLGYEAGLLVLVAVGLAMIVPSPPAALGVFEAAVVVALGAFGIESSRALSYALVLHAVNFFPYLAAGLLAVPRGRGR